VKLSAAEKAARKRQRFIDKAREYSTGTYSNRFVAPVFQKMIRAEWGAQTAGDTPAVVDGIFGYVYRDVGQCVCVTCGKVKPWTTHNGSMQTGHFIPSRRNSILYRYENTAPQCVWCNQYRGGAVEDYTLWMEEVRGSDTIYMLRQLKNTIRQFTREELVDMRIDYQRRLDLAVERMEWLGSYR